ncbi:MAG: carbohydrate kinase [Spirochaetae bacterium HGW-Spirochaetae-1]|nr:MAG: carbohydrate kinase [Spirochaetae bacterium HGW-Spirochaetae-1]
MADKKYVIAIDSGTQNIRAIMFDRTGKEVASAEAPIEPYFSLHPGWAEQNPSDYWSKLCQASRAMMKKAKVPREEIGAMGITSQRTTFLTVDREGTPLRPAIVWLDQRRVEYPPPLSLGARAVFNLPVISGLMKYVRENSKYLWIKCNEPDIYRKTAKFLLITGWFVKKLTGEFRESRGMVNVLWPIDLKKFAWYTYKFLYEIFGLKPDHLPELCDQDEILGYITKTASRETGLPEGLPVIVGGGDKQSELLGAGGLNSETGVISFGTLTTLNVITKKYVTDKQWRFFAWPGAIPCTWNIETYINRGFWMVTWFKEELGHRESIEAERRGVAPEVVLDEVIRSIPPGSMGLMLQPHWGPLSNNKFAKGSIIGFGDVHTRAHIYRAILEGLGFELRRLYEIINAETGITLKELRVGGGGSRSDAAVQIAADIFNLPVSRMATSEIGSLGAAVSATVGSGMFSSFDEAVSSMVKKIHTFEPDPKNRRIYDDLYRQVFLATYEKLEPLYMKIASITGYPPAQ